MARSFRTAIDLGKSELQNARIQNLSAAPGTPATGQVYWDTVLAQLRIYNGSAWIALGTPEGIDPKASVRVATTANGTLATAFENGDTVDGVVLATGDRILLKNQTTGAENGVYTVNASGAPTRATDFDESTETTANAYVWVSEGTTNADTAWVLTTNDPITIGSTSLTWVQYSGLGQISVTAPITKSGNTLALDYDNTTIGLDGSNKLTSLTGRKYSATFGDGAATAFNIDHNFNTKDVHVQVRDASTDRQVECDVVMSTVNRVVLTFDTAPASNAYRVVVKG